MRRRYSIWVRENGSDHDVELCDVNDNPAQMKKALQSKRIRIGKGRTIAKYTDIRIVDNQATP